MVDLNIPVGVSDFEKLRENNYYYIDKTGFISKLLHVPGVLGKHLACVCWQVFLIFEKTAEPYLKGWKFPKILLYVMNG